MSNEPSKVDIVVTLVHGTFARGAPWTDEKSPFTQALVDDLGVNVLVESYRWSGRNSLVARAEAANGLAAALRNLRRREDLKDAKHFVIGHSHGGAVAYYASRQARDENGPSNVDGVICLSTPFINLYERPYSELLLNSLAWGMLLLPAVGGFLGYTLFSMIDPSGWFRWVVGVALTLAGAYAGLICRAGVLAYLQWSRQYINRLLWPRPIDNVLLVRLPGDEASLVLGIASCACWLWQMVISPMLQPLVWLQRLGQATGKRQPMNELIFVLVRLSVVLLAWAQSAYLLLLTPVLIPSVAILALPFGVVLAVHSLFVEIHVDAAPYGSWRICCLPQQRSAEIFRLRHSSYLHHEIARYLSSWIKNGEVDVSTKASPKPWMMGV